MNDFIIVSLSFIAIVVFMYIFIYFTEKTKNKYNTEAISTVKENTNSTNEFQVTVTSDVALNEIIKEINLQNKKIIEISNRNNGDSLYTTLFIK